MSGSVGAGCAVTPEVVHISGVARTQFADVAETFARTVAAQGSGGAALCIRHHNEVVVDLVGGDYREDSLQLLFSISKALTAVAAARAHECGEIDLDAPVANYWPELDRPSTRKITPRMVLAHRSGLASLDRALTFAEVLAGLDDDAVGHQEPYWEPDRAHGYHSFTYGTLMNGIFRRVLGVSIGEYFELHIAKPLGLDLWIGTPESVFPRIEKINYTPPRISIQRAGFVSGTPIPPGTSAQLARTIDFYNSPDLYRACCPSTSGVGSARALARFFEATLRDGAMISASSRTAMIAPRSRGLDRVLGIPTQFASGMQLAFPVFPMLGARSYGHEAAGGSAAFADDEFDIAVGYTTNVYPPMSGASGGFLMLLPVIRHCLTADHSVI